MSKITFEDYMVMQARLQKREVCKEFSQSVLADAVGREADLHDQILEVCKRKRWIAFHDRMDVKTTGNVGRPDFVILADGGRLFMVECKSKTGKLTPEQAGIQLWADNLGHDIRVVRSITEFMNVINETHSKDL
jgi:hypothetical protein